MLIFIVIFFVFMCIVINSTMPSKKYLLVIYISLKTTDLTIREILIAIKDILLSTRLLPSVSRRKEFNSIPRKVKKKNASLGFYRDAMASLIFLIGWLPRVINLLLVSFISKKP